MIVVGLFPVTLDLGGTRLVGSLAHLVAQDTFVGVRAETWTGWGVWVTLVVCILLAGAVIGQLSGIRRLRLWQARPYVVVDTELDENFLIALTVRNTGQTAASNVLIRLDERVRSSADDLDLDWQDGPLFIDGLPLLAPGRGFRFAFDRYPDRRASGYPMVIRGAVSYAGYSGRQTYHEVFVADLADYTGAMAAEKGLPELAESMNSLRESLANVVATSGRPAPDEPEWAEAQVIASHVAPGIVTGSSNHGTAASQHGPPLSRSERAFLMFDRLLGRKP